MPCLSLDFLTLFSFCGRRNSELVFQTNKNFDNNQDIFLSPFERNLAIFLMFLKWHLHWKKSDTFRSLSSKSFNLTKMSFKGRREKIMWNVFFPFEMRLFNFDNYNFIVDLRDYEIVFHFIPTKFLFLQNIILEQFDVSIMSINTTRH